MDTLERLKIFCLVAEKQSFAQSALHLGLPRSTVTHAIQCLEKKYEILLFYRNTRHVTLTEEGGKFYEEVKQIVEKMKNLQYFRDSMDQKKAKIRLSLPKPIAVQIILPHIHEYLALHPNISVILNTDDSYINLLENELDCVIRIGDVQSEGLPARLVGYTSLLTLAAPCYLKKYGIPNSLEQLPQHLAIDYRLDQVIRDYTILNFRNQALKLNYQIAVGDTISYVQAGLSGLGIIQIPHFDAIQYIKNRTLQPICQFIEPESLAINLLMIERKYRPDYMSDFIEWLHTQLNKVIVDTSTQMNS